MTSSSKSVLILGANGLFGLHCALAFAQCGWHVYAQTRATSKPDPKFRSHSNIEHCAINLEQLDQLSKVANKCRLIINALNPSYGEWETEVPRYTAGVLALAKSSGARVLIPGNVYNFGADMPELLNETTPHAPTNQWGQIRAEMERSYREANKFGVRTIILRTGDFLQREESGNWFDTHMIAGLNKGKFAYPGNPNIPRAYGYLPDVARAAVGLAEIQDELGDFTDVPFSGTTISGNELVQEIAKTLGHTVKRTTIPWIIIKLMALFRKDMRGVVAMSYLWNVPHRLDGTKLKQLLPEFEPTPTADIIKDCVSRYA